MSVKLREKQLKSGQISFYLDIYHNKTRWYEFLEIHIQKNRPSPEDKDKKRLAQEIRTKREHELIVEDNGLFDKRRKQACFIKYFEQFIRSKPYNGLYEGALINVLKFAGKQPVSFIRLNEQWLCEFQKFLLKTVCNNSAFNYMGMINAAINEAIRQKIINRNPFKDMSPKDKLRKQDTIRDSYSIEQLQHLANTDCNVSKQIKQGYFFSAFSSLRWSDVNPLRWDEIKIRNIQGVETYFIHFEQEKTEHIEYLPLCDAAVDILKERQIDALLEEKSPHVFPQLKEEEPSRRAYQRTQRAMKRWAKAAGIDPKKLYFHTARHSFATNVLENSPDGDLYTVSKLMGHKSISTTQIYAHVRDNRKLSAVQALPKITFNTMNIKKAS